MLSVMVTRLIARQSTGHLSSRTDADGPLRLSESIAIFYFEPVPSGEASTIADPTRKSFLGRSVMEPVNLSSLAELCDAIFRGDPADRQADPYLFAVIKKGDSFELIEYGVVSKSELSDDVKPPEGCLALVLQCGGWIAPVAESFDGSGPEHPRPSVHPQRKRMFCTTAIGNDSEIVTVLRVAGDPSPQTITGECIGVVPQALRSCWSRRILSDAA